MTPITSAHTSAGWGLSLSYSLIQWLLLPRLPQIRKELPGLNLRILNRPTNEVAIRPRDGTVDMGLVRDGSVAPSLKGIELGLMTYSLFLRRGCGLHWQRQFLSSENSVSFHEAEQRAR